MFIALGENNTIFLSQLFGHSNIIDTHLTNLDTVILSAFYFSLRLRNIVFTPVVICDCISRQTKINNNVYEMRKIRFSQLCRAGYIAIDPEKH